MKNIILIGFMGAGKTTIGQALAKYYDIAFIDTDDYIAEKEDRTIAEIFQSDGEAYFRRLETQCLTELADSKEPMIIATGGGMPLQKENNILFKQIGMVIFLDYKFKTIWKRIRGSKTRPLVKKGREAIFQLFLERRSTYSKIADEIVDGEELQYDEIIQYIVKINEGREEYHENRRN